MSAGAGDPVTATIEQAQSYALKKNRDEAAALLRRAIDVTASRTARVRLRETLHQIARVFFTDQGQRAFETGQTILFENPDAALIRLREAAALENGNLSVRLALIKVYLLKQDCAAARSEVVSARALDPADGDGFALEARAFACDHQPLLHHDVTAAPSSLTRWQEQFVAYVHARESLHQGSPARAAESLARVAAEFPRFPEARFYLARAEAAAGGGGEDALRKYVGLCKVITGRDRREYGLEPRVCSHQKEAEDELAKKPVDL